MAAGQHSTHSCGARSGAGRPSPAFVGGGLFLLLAYTTWVWAGLRPSLHIVGVALAGVLLAGLLAGRPEIRRAVLRDRYLRPPGERPANASAWMRTEPT